MVDVPLLWCKYHTNICWSVDRFSKIPEPPVDMCIKQNVAQYSKYLMLYRGWKHLKPPDLIETIGCNVSWFFHFESRPVNIYTLEE